MRKYVGVSKFLVCMIVMLCAHPAFATLTFSAAGTVSSPADGATIHTGGILHTATIPVSTTNQHVAIDGAAANAAYNVQWSMHTECDTDIDTTAEDDGTSQIIHCDLSGHWEKDANSTGSLSGTYSNRSVGSHTATSYTDFVDNNTSSNNKNKTDNHSVTVADP